jgi:hypothetical protein
MRRTLASEFPIAVRRDGPLPLKIRLIGPAARGVITNVILVITARAKL